MKELLYIIRVNILFYLIPLVLLAMLLGWFLSNSKSRFDSVEHNPQEWVTTRQTKIKYSFDKEAEQLSLPAGLQLEPLALVYGKSVIVELPDGQRGIVDPMTLSGSKDTTLLGGIKYIDEYVLGFKFVDIRENNRTVGQNLAQLESKLGDAIFVKNTSSTDQSRFYLQARCMTDTTLCNGAWVTLQNDITTSINGANRRLKNTWVTRLPAVIDIADRFMPFVESIYLDEKPYDVFEFKALWRLVAWLITVALGLLLLATIWIFVPFLIARIVYGLVLLLSFKWAPNFLVGILSFILCTAALFVYCSITVLEVRPFWLIAFAAMTITSIYCIAISSFTVGSDRCPSCHKCCGFGVSKQTLEPVVEKVNPNDKEEGYVPYRETTTTVTTYSCEECGYEAKEKESSSKVFTVDFDADFSRPDQEDETDLIDPPAPIEQPEMEEQEEEEVPEKKEEERDFNTCRYFNSSASTCTYEVHGMSYDRCPCDGYKYSHHCPYEHINK